MNSPDAMIPWAPFRVVISAFVGTKSTIAKHSALRELSQETGLGGMTGLQYLRSANVTTYHLYKMMEKVK